jgi:predicted enzyme related to lactoylglutathione lyase
MWLTYLATDNADAAADRIKGAGGQIVMDPMDVMEHGRMVVAIDPAGAPFGLWQGHRHTGAELVNEQGALTWTEQFSHDFEASKTFYHAVFGYEYTDMSGEGFTYATFKVGGKDVGGMGAYPADAQGGAHPAWSVYFGATDTDATVARVIGEGGSTLREAENSPYGRLATVTDDQGAVFSIISVNGS